MALSANALKWLIRFYPPLFFQRIWVKNIRSDWRGVTVKVNKSLLNLNYNRSIFGGTLFVAADPFYPILFYQIFTKKGYNIIVWMKSAEVQYMKPAMTTLTFNIYIDDKTIEEAEHILNTDGKYTKFLPIEMYDKKGDLCVMVFCEVYVRNLNIIK
ncbi:uncharacterized protein DUF4442 [Mucilaginibacter yixingensis]|uniref:Uncharacterized protein DUF4442 n=1 Tax=Mucilaginibacter yixingensis TaxID=1295612 RepID=A0A2T5J647_9SPHI|nr:DUF4442 domain-containing protein [Mucilaginibacter yixingensis]PTQ94025.1 uncharacterized protein DUF4442 [Mucilaginibacter yixingensis]